MIRRRSFVLGAAATCAAAVHAQEAFPRKPISFVVPWGAGGSNDVIARTLGTILGEDGLQVVVENAPGASGAIGLTKVANAPADGHTLGMGTSSTLSYMAMGKTPLKNQQFDHLARLAVDPLILVVPANSPHSSLDDYLARTRKGGVATIAASGDFNCTHVLAAMTAQNLGARLIYAPYAGGTKILSDLLGNHLEAAVLKPSDCRTQLDAKSLRALGVYSRQRLAQLPDVPTFAEKKIDVFSMGPVVQMSYVVAPAGLPAPVKDRLIQSVRKATRDARFTKLAAQSAFLVDDLVGDALAAEVVAVGNAVSAIAAKVLK